MVLLLSIYSEIGVVYTIENEPILQKGNTGLSLSQGTSGKRHIRFPHIANYCNPC